MTTVLTRLDIFEEVTDIHYPVCLYAPPDTSLAYALPILGRLVAESVAVLSKELALAQIIRIRSRSSKPERIDI